MDDQRPTTRLSLKNRHPNWKEKLRQSCLKRVQQERSRLIWKIRSSKKTHLNQKEIAESAFRDIVSDELEKIKQSSLNDCREISTCDDNEDLLWEYDGPLIPSETTESMYLELLIEMDRLLHEDLSAEARRETALIEDYEKVCEQQDEYLAQALFEHMQLNEELADRIWCPICKKAYLQQNRHIIYCPSCKLQLDVQIDQVNLDFLRSRLVEVLDEHLDKGCKENPKFCTESKFGFTALYIQCQTCNTFEIVL